ncbi:hypothetical protein OH799_35335 [Nocardia sp. NBC_00881]|uniref:hypothetical protein n=1 Tax=Nocardia sp. NBC_00881 TaxID=2975995 RepID=UPI00386DEB24|nr:hypothetical protein OH799_35335 [Nocardia sp. NBC_00881]
MKAFELGRENLNKLIADTIEFDGNEATTRFRIIDRLLGDVLRWPPESIECEKHIDGDYLDYVLGNPDKQIVVEAKRTSKTFEAPAGLDSGRINLGTLRNYSKSNAASIDQVLRYCQSAGIGVALLSNGNQYVGFLGSRSDGKKPVDGSAYYYACLADVAEKFAEFWDFFSRDGISRKRIFSALMVDKELTPPPAPLSKRIVGYPGYRIGTEMEIDLRILGDLFIHDVMREEGITDEFLRECYCSSGALSQYAAVSKEILKTRYMRLKRAGEHRERCQ